jgi:hypothetical protein
MYLIPTNYSRLCAKLFLRAESQALDRILIEFSRRYWEHNSNCILGSASESLSLYLCASPHKYVMQAMSIRSCIPCYC